MRRPAGRRRNRAPAGRIANAARIGWGAFFLGSGAFNALVTVPNADGVFAAFADMSWPVAEQLVRDVVRPFGMACAVLVVVFEIATGLLILTRRTARVGIMTSLAWLAALIPFLDGFGLVNVVLIVALFPLLLRDY